MKVFAYCAESYRQAARQAAGVEPVTCPPASFASFDVAQLEGNDFLYFDLHGYPGSDRWFGDAGIAALTAQQVGAANLEGSVVFATNCYLADAASVMLDALLSAGARYVIAGSGENYAWSKAPGGASLMALWVRRLMQVGISPLAALRVAKVRVMYSRNDIKTIDDTLAFRAYERKGMA